MIYKDVCIIGAGPAGITTALFLAKKGIACTIIDKSKFPRDKICGDAFSGKVSWVLRKLEIDLDIEISKQDFQIPSWGIKFYGSKNNELKIPFKLNYDSSKDKAPGFIASRLEFDNFLVQKAKENPNIEFIEEISIIGYKKNIDSITIYNKDKNFQLEAKLLVVANGAYSKLAKELVGLDVEEDSNSLGIRTYYKNVEELDKEGYIELHFLKEFSPGYFWIFPMANGMANVGAGIRTDLMKKDRINIKKEFKNIIEHHPVISKRFKNAELIDGIKLYGLPLASKKRKLSTNNVLLLGDSAALIDPFTGEGIGNAMISGMLAADQVEKSLNSNDFSENCLSDYDNTLYKRLSSEFQLSKKMQDLSKYPFLINFVVNKARRNKELQELISCMFENVDIREKFKNPMFYLKILFT